MDASERDWKPRNEEEGEEEKDGSKKGGRTLWRVWKQFRLNLMGAFLEATDAEMFLPCGSHHCDAAKRVQPTR